MRVIAVPVKALAGAKGRLASVLTPTERAALTLTMLEDVLDAATGRPGLEAAAKTTQAVATQLKIPAVQVLVASTGVIGVPLKLERVTSKLPELAARITGSADLFAGADRRPFASIDYVACHDGFTLRDLVSYRGKHNAANFEDGLDGSDDNRSDNHGVEGETTDPDIIALRVRQAKNLLTTTLLSAGTPMLLAGDERGRTQHGNNNAYCQDNELSWMDWTSLGPWISVRDHVQLLLRLRRDHAVFGPERFWTEDELGWFRPDGRRMDDTDWPDPELACLGMFFVADEGAGDSFLLWQNASPHPVEAKLPGPPLASTYRLVFDTGDELGGSDFDGDDTITLRSRSAVLFRVASRPPATTIER